MASWFTLGFVALGCGSSGDGGGGGGSGSTAVLYAPCSGTPFTNDGSCAGGVCASGDVAVKVFAAWRSKVLSLSGLSEQELDKRVSVSAIDTSSASFVEIKYIVVLDWARSRQVDSVGISGLSSPPTDAEIEKAVKLAVEVAEWTGLGGIASVASEVNVQAAFDGCGSDIPIDWCHIDFMNVTGTLNVWGIKEVNAANNDCLQATVDVAKGVVVDCIPVPCAVN